MSGKTLFLATLGLGLLLTAISMLSLSALDSDNPEIAFIGPVICLAIWAVYLIALLYLAGRAISFKQRPGEAGTSILLACFLTPLILAAVPIALATQGALGLASLLGGTEEAAPVAFEDLDPLAEEAPPAEIEAPSAYGDDAVLDALQDACAGGDQQACSDLFMQSAAGSEYESFAQAQMDAAVGSEIGGDGEGAIEMTDVDRELLGDFVADYGSNPELDALAEGCYLGDGFEACEALLAAADEGSSYSIFASDQMASRQGDG